MMGREREAGTVEVGRIADLVVLLMRTRWTSGHRRVNRVIRGGTWWDITLAHGQVQRNVRTPMLQTTPGNSARQEPRTRALNAVRCDGFLMSTIVQSVPLVESSNASRHLWFFAGHWE